MPILAGVGTPTPPPPPDIVPPTPVVSDAYTLTWTAPDGGVWPLMNAELGWHLEDGIAGVLGVAPIAFATDADPAGGATVRHIQPQPRIMTLPLRIDGPDEAVHRTRLRQLGRAFTMTRRRGPGTLTIGRPDGSSRQIRAYFQSGFDPAGGNLSGWLYSDIVLQLFCPDPYWFDVAPMGFSRDFEASPADYQDPFPTLSSSQTLGETIVNNPGDVEAWPTWVITGPATLITATNNTTGKTFTIDPNADGISHGDLASGEQITITSRPPTVRGPDGTVWTAALGFPDSANLWPLEPGDNDITLGITGADDGTSIVGSFLNRWETA